MNGLLFTLTPQTKDVVRGFFSSKNSLQKVNVAIQDLIPEYLDKMENVTEVVVDFMTKDVASAIICRNYA